KQHTGVSLEPDDLTFRITRRESASVNYTIDSTLAEPEIGQGGRTPVAFPRPAIRDFAVGLLRDQGVEPDPALRPVEDDLRVCTVFQQFLRARFTYTLEMDAVPPGEDPIERFLFVTRRGHCEYFASAMAALCRSVGVGAR